MNRTRYQELLGRLLEGELARSQADELAAALKENSSLRRDLRQHLVLWEAFSQNQSPERSAEAFLRSLETRMRVENEGNDIFPSSVRIGIESASPHRILRTKGRFLHTGSWMTVRWRVAAAFVVLFALIAAAGVLWFVARPSAQAATTIQGDAVCMACALQEGNEHFPAIKVASQIYFLEHNQVVDQTVAGVLFCGRSIPVIAKGYPRMQGTRLLFDATSFTLPGLQKPPQK